MNERGSQVTVGRGRIRLRSSYRSARIALHISHWRPQGVMPSFGRRDDEAPGPRPRKHTKKKKWR